MTLNASNVLRSASLSVSRPVRESSKTAACQRSMALLYFLICGHITTRQHIACSHHSSRKPCTATMARETFPDHSSPVHFSRKGRVMTTQTPPSRQPDLKQQTRVTFLKLSPSPLSMRTALPPRIGIHRSTDLFPVSHQRHQSTPTRQRNLQAGAVHQRVLEAAHKSAIKPHLAKIETCPHVCQPKHISQAPRTMAGSQHMPQGRTGKLCTLVKYAPLTHFKGSSRNE